MVYVIACWNIELLGFSLTVESARYVSCSLLSFFPIFMFYYYAVGFSLHCKAEQGCKLITAYSILNNFVMSSYFDTLSSVALFPKD